MKNFDKTFFGLFIGFAFPFILGLLFSFLWFFMDKNESRVLFYLIFGLISGVIIDLKFLRRWIANRYDLALWFIISIYLIYNIGMYGFFMGFPVFNALLGIVAGYYFGKKIIYKKIKSKIQTKMIKQVSMFTAFIMALICISTAVIALNEKAIGEEVRGMLGLNFEITQTLIYAIIVVGGLGLVVAEYYVTKVVMEKTIKFTVEHSR